jgi:hypothetical protein
MQYMKLTGKDVVIVGEIALDEIPKFYNFNTISYIFKI